MKLAIALVAACALAACATADMADIGKTISPLDLAAPAEPPREVMLVEVPRTCAPLPELRAGASGTERRIHTQTIVRMYAACAGSAP